MTKSDSWSRIVQVSEQRRNASARRLARLVTRAAEAQHQLDVLGEYWRDYAARFETNQRTGMRGEWLHDYQSFLTNLERAVALQSDAVKTLQHQVAEARTRLVLDGHRTESYQIIGDRRTEAARTLEQRQQQKLQDEMVPRLASKLVA